MRSFILALGLSLGVQAAPLGVQAAHAAEMAPLRIGVLNDLSGVYSDFQGIGSVIAA